MKDAPVMDDPDFFIDIDATGGSGASLLKILSPAQEDKNHFPGGTAAEGSGSTGRREKKDGRINYLYAITFAEPVSYPSDVEYEFLFK